MSRALGKQIALYFLFLGNITLFAQTDSTQRDTITINKSGIQIVFKEHGNGIALLGKKYLTTHFIIKSSQGREIKNTYQQGNSTILSMVDNERKQAWIDALRYLQVGDDVRIYVPDSIVTKNWRAFLPTPPFKPFSIQVRLLVLAAEDELPPNAVVLDETDTKIPPPFDVEGKDTIKLKSGLRYIIVHDNLDGDPTYNGRKVAIHYTGFFEDGTIFDASYPNGHPFIFTLTRNEVIDGLDEGVRLMKAGDKFRFLIPPKIGYGDKAAGIIPANTNLIFDVELISVD